MPSKNFTKKETRKVKHSYSVEFENGYCPLLETTETLENIKEKCRKANATLKFYM